MLLVEQPAGWAPERDYAAHVVLTELLGLPVETVTADRSDTRLTVRGEGGQVLLRDGLFGLPEAARLTPASLPHEPFESLDGLPFLYGAPLLETGPNDATLGVDVLGSSFVLLSRYEEVVTPVTDRHGRFPASASLLSRAGLLGRPLVNEWAELLWRTMTAVWPRLERPPRAFQLVPSHDVDWPRTPKQSAAFVVRRAAADVLRRHDLGTAVARLRGRLGGPDPNDTFDWIMDASEARGLRSAFYFIVDGPTPELECGYAIDDPWIRGLIRRMHQRGHEIGLHGSYRSFDEGARLQQEADVLRAVCAEESVEQPTWGGRQHFLRWENPATWRHWDETGLDYDSTVGFHDAVGFRCGCCCEFPVFDLLLRKQLRLRERPLVAMDVALLDREGLDERAAAERLAALKEQCRRFGGTFTLLWHNTRLVRSGERRVYLSALDA